MEEDDAATVLIFEDEKASDDVSILNNASPNIREASQGVGTKVSKELEAVPKIHPLLSPPQPAPLEKTTLTIATFNLKSNIDPEDIEWFVKDIASRDVDVAAIQGVVKRGFDPLFRTFKSLGYQYSRFDQLSSVKDRTSSEFLFSKVPILKKEFKLFVGSHQSRGISKYLVRAAHRSSEPYEVWVATSQLETGGSGNGVRKTQIIEIASELGGDVPIEDRMPRGIPAVFAGDTQIPSWQNVSPEYKCPSGWRDAWWEKGSADNEKTSLQDRMDQIWFGPGGLECISFDMCCDKQGVVATFRKA